MFAVKLLLVTALTTTLAYANIVKTPYIFGGKDAQIGQFPYVVKVVYEKNFSCTGAILSDRWILTSAYCVYWKKEQDLSVIVGTIEGDGTLGSYHSVEYYAYHPNYNRTNDDFDVALIKTTQPIVFSDRVQPIPIDGLPIHENEHVTFAGWGEDKSTGGMAPTLRYLDSMTVTNEKCIELFNEEDRVINEEELCTFGQAGSGGCYYDMGAPLVNRGFLVGVRLVRTCNNGKPDIFLRASAIYEWIVTTMKIF